MTGQRVRQVEQRASQGEVVAGLAGQPRALAEVGDRLGLPPGEAEVDPAGDEQAGRAGRRPRRGPGRGRAPRRTACPRRASRRTPPAPPAGPGRAPCRCPDLARSTSTAAVSCSRASAWRPHRRSARPAMAWARAAARASPRLQVIARGPGSRARRPRPSRRWCRRPRRRVPTTPQPAAACCRVCRVPAWVSSAAVA